MRDDFLDRYFKGTYLEWGMRYYRENTKEQNKSIISDSHDSTNNLIANVTQPTEAPTQDFKGFDPSNTLNQKNITNE